MTDGIDIGGQSRRFQATVILVTMLALLAGALAAATLSGGASIVDIDLGGDGDRGADPPDIQGGDSVEGGDGGGSGFELPDFLVDVLQWFFDEGEPGNVDEAEIPHPPYNITLDREPTPGGVVVVTVEKDGDPVPFALVSFEGEPVGRANATGQLRARVPYTEELTVTAEPPSREDGGSLGPPRISGGGRLGSPGDPGGGSVGTPRISGGGRLGSPGGSGGRWLGALAASNHLGTPAAGTQTEDPPANSSATFEVRTDAAARVDGVALPGETATVQFTVGGNPLPAVGVVRDGEQVGVTDGNGTVDIEIPASATQGGSVPVALARGEFAGDAAIEVGEVTVSVDTGLLAIPGTGAAVAVTAVDSTDEEPRQGVPVTVVDGDERVTDGSTGADGRLSFTLPWTDSVTATATTEYGPVSATVTGMWLYLAGVVVALGLPVIGVAVWARQNPATRRRARERFVGVLVAAGALLQGAGRRFVAFVRRVPVVGTVRRVLGGIASVAGWLSGRLMFVAGRLRAGLAFLWRRLRAGAWLALLVAGPRWLLARLWAGLRWLAGLPWRLLASEDEGTESSEESTTTAERVTHTTDPEPQSAYARLRRYWHWLVRRVAGRTGGRTKTPVEIEQQAVDRGLPAAAVRRLRRAFQDVEYGPDDAEERVEDAESAHGQLRREGEQ